MKIRRRRSLVMANCSCRSHGGFLTERGLAELAERTSLEGLLPRGDGDIVDRSVSVSALVEVEDLFAHVTDQQLTEQYERFHNGS